jgi:hypothetical protein
MKMLDFRFTSEEGKLARLHCTSLQGSTRPKENNAQGMKENKMS